MPTSLLQLDPLVVAGTVPSAPRCAAFPPIMAPIEAQWPFPISLLLVLGLVVAGATYPPDATFCTVSVRPIHVSSLPRELAA